MNKKNTASSHLLHPLGVFATKDFFEAPEAITKKGPVTANGYRAFYKYGTEGRTRTGMGRPTDTSSLRVYQFHHFGNPYFFRSDNKNCYLLCTGGWGAAPSDEGNGIGALCGSAMGAISFMTEPSPTLVDT